MKLFELWATLGLDTRDFEQGTNSARGKAQSFGNTIQSSVKASTVAVGNLMSTAVQKVAGGFVDMTKQAFNAVATLEQNIGGSEQVFGDYAAEIQNWGKEAFQYVGLSQGEYLGYANRMGSLLQGMGFSQEQSLDLTTDAMQRAADVASIMGIDVSSAMEAIAGAAKGNFTMMDNLGVAINDTALANYALETGITKSVSKMSTQEKVALALEMFLNKTAYAAGNYAKENDTLAGSIQTAKASFDNLLAGSGTVDDFVRTVENAARVAFKNLKEIVPRLGQSIVSAGKLFAPKVESVLSNLWDNELPGFITRGVNGLINGVNDLLGTNIPTISEINLPTWAEMKTKATLWWSGIKTNFQNLFDWTLKMFSEPSEGLDEAAAAIQDWWDEKALPGILSVSQWTLGLFDVPIEDSATVGEHISAWWNGVALPGITEVTQWTFGKLILPAWADLVESVVLWWKTDISPFISGITEWLVNPEFPTYEAFMEKASSWWASVKTRIQSLFTVYATIDFSRTYTPEELSAAGNWEIDTTAGATIPVKKQYASGLSYVPYDNYLSYLHAGEAVLTRQQAENWRSGGSGGASADEIAAAVSSALEGKVVVLGDQIVGVLTDKIDRSLSKKTKMTRRYAAT